MVRIAVNATFITNARNSGGTYDYRFPWRIVLHTIEGSSSPAVAAAHPYVPHVWYDPATRVLLQTVPFDRSAFALYSDGIIPTNKACALQVEISGRAQNTPDWPTHWLDNIAEDVIIPMCQFVAEQGAQIDLFDVPEAGAIAMSASATAPQRMSISRWSTFKGICGHRHVPTNDHWDPGAMDVKRIATHAALLIGELLSETTRVNPPTPQPKLYDGDPMIVVEDVRQNLWLFNGWRYKQILPADWATKINPMLVAWAKAGIIRTNTDGSPYIGKMADEGWDTFYLKEI